MPTRTAKAQWKGDLKDGGGTMRTQTGSFDGPYSFTSRFEEGSGTNPEELIAAAHAGCFSMALSANLAKAGHTPENISTTARVHLEKGDEGFSITRIELITEGEVPGLDEESFRKHAEDAKEGCPVSRLLKGGARIDLEASLTG